MYISPESAKSIPKEVARKYNLIPISEKNGRLVVA